MKALFRQEQQDREAVRRRQAQQWAARAEQERKAAEEEKAKKKKGAKKRKAGGAGTDAEMGDASGAESVSSEGSNTQMLRMLAEPPMAVPAGAPAGLH